jgi:hypothetical protein
MPKLLFRTDGIVSGKVVFKAGQVYDISDENGSATRWIKRGAEIVDEPIKPIILKEEAVQVEESPKEEINEPIEANVEVVKKPLKKENKKEIKSSK